MSSTDRILDLIDAGLQSSSESDRYLDVAPSVGEGCVRCGAGDVPEGGDLCDGCRAFLLGDSEDDPGQWIANALWERAEIPAEITRVVGALDLPEVEASVLARLLAEDVARRVSAGGGRV